jgi:serine/threonine protein kinase
VGRYEILLDLQDEGFVSLMVAKVRGPNAGPLFVELSRVERTLARSVEVKEAFLAEARAAGRVRHPNFVHPIDTLAHDGDLYGATEFALGARLDEIWRAAATERYEIPLPVSLRIILDVLAGLSALHASGANMAGSRAIVHGDVAPTNVFVTERGDTRLVHSGLSSVTSRAGAIGARNHRLAYKAPEQLRTGVNAVPTSGGRRIRRGCFAFGKHYRSTPFDDDNVEVVEHILYGQIPPLEPGGSRYSRSRSCRSSRTRSAKSRRSHSNAATLAEAIGRAPGIPLASTEEVAAVIAELMGPSSSDGAFDRRARSALEQARGPRPVAGPHRRSCGRR